jgi:peptidoglycan/xylan/chitin deacetylase (PgdA/CDA1 family)
MMSGIVTISIELELGWGMHDKAEYSYLSDSREAETQALCRLLDLADQHELPITFDVVGHLFHQSCSGTHSGPYPETWWSEDPGTNQDTHPQFYAPDLIQEIHDRQTEHELATHTYSHILADKATPEQLNHELSKVKQVHAEFGVPEPTSIVMPRHQDPNYSVLSEQGIETIRQVVDGHTPSFSNRIAELWWLLTREHPRSTLRQKRNLIETTVTPYPSLTSGLLPSGQSSLHPVLSLVPLSLRQLLHRRYLIDAIDRAAKNGSHIHLWTHVFNMANDKQWPPIKAGLSYLAEQRDEGHLEIKRMDELQP